MGVKRKRLFLVLGSITVAVIAALLIWFGLRGKQEVLKTGNLADIDWYDENEKEFTITTAQELYDVATLSYFYDFNGQTIKLGADIVVNDGNAEDWFDKAPVNRWYSIKNFAGTFDGQGHSISGIYVKTSDNANGLFTYAQKTAVVRDFKLLNSCFDVIGSKGTASVASHSSGTYSKIYCDTLIHCDGGKVAGIASMPKDGTVIQECWFDGEIYSTGRFGGGIVDYLLTTEAVIEHCLNSGYYRNTWTRSSCSIGGICGVVLQQGAKLTMNDCLNVGVIDTDNIYRVGSVFGGNNDNTTVDISNAYATSESYSVAISNVIVDVNGGGIRLDETYLQGTNAYQWTTLDFEQYWAIVTDGTPILKCFAEEIPSIDGLEKKFSLDWYDADAQEYVIDDLKSLYGFSLIAQTTDYKDKVIKLGADIVVNEGKAEKWGKAAPENPWFSIPSFSGTLDGQGHTISGIYRTGEKILGFFEKTTMHSTIKNLNLKNSYFYAWGDDSTDSLGFVGSFAGRGGGTFDTVYSDAIIVNDGYGAGGFLGQANVDVTKFTNCWFNGTIHMRTQTGRSAGGFTGCAVIGETTIEHCLMTGLITSQITEKSARVGGFVGTTMNKGIILNVKDCLNAGEMNTENKVHLGSVLGVALNGTIVTIDDTFATTESCLDASGQHSDLWILGTPTVIGGAINIDKADLIGNGGYQWSTLDFSNYWTIVLDNTPILRSYATKIHSVKGLQKFFDISWYDVNKKTYSIATKEQLIGFTMLSGTTDFAGKTIKLGADITLNEGTAADWGTNAPQTAWKAIQTFAGTFDGQGHTVRGVYLNTNSSSAGLFSQTTKDAYVKNLRLENCYISSTGNFVGSISGRGGGTFDTIYSNAIIVGSGAGNGGILGQMNLKDTTTKITNCWFDGAISLVEDGYMAGGIVGTTVAGTTNVEHCLNTSSIQCTQNKTASRLGGICGIVQNKETILNIKDCLTTGTITTINKVHVGAAIGVNTSGSYMNLESIYATNESYGKVIGTKNDTVTGGVSQIAETTILGYGGYQWMALDFNNYWTVDLGGTPILKSFASEIPSLTGVEKLFDVSWYDSNAKEYVLSNKAQLNGFAMIAASTNFAGKTVKLGANIVLNTGNAVDWEENTPEIIWSPIAEFAGTFDGRGFTLEGLYINSDNSEVGLFATTTKDAIVRNLKLQNGFITSSGDFIGSIVGRGGGTFERIYSDAIIKSSGSSLGGMIGAVNTGTTIIEECWFAGRIEISGTGINAGGIVGGHVLNNLRMQYCLNTGDIISTNPDGKNAAGKVEGACIGGLCGPVLNDAVLSMKNCLNVGKITTMNNVNVGSVIAGCKGKTSVTIETTYTTSDSYNKSVGGMYGKVQGNPSQYTESVLKGYGACVITELDFKDYWVAISGKTPKLKYFASQQDTVLDPSKAIVPNTSWIEETEGTAKDPYKITTPGDLYGFAKLANAGNNFKGKTIQLQNEIIVNEGTPTEWGVEGPAMAWTPIKEFAGIFDGQGFAIKGLYVNTENSEVGLFGKTTADAVVKNLQLKSSAFISSGDYLGSISGRGGGTFDTIFSDANVQSSGTCVGGILGQVNAGPTKVTNCWFAGSVEISGTGIYVGGIVGGHALNTLTIQFCHNSGTIKSTNSDGKNAAGNLEGACVGGICGPTLNDSILTIENSLNTGMISSVNTVNVGTILAGSKGQTTVSIRATYDKSGDDTWNLYGGMYSRNQSVNAQSVDEELLKGQNAFDNTNLDFVEHWTAKEGHTPELTSFTSNAGNVSYTEIKPCTDWYSDGEGKTFVISTAADLWGVSKLASQGKTFAKQTIKLGCDIIVNQGDASKWNTSNKPQYAEYTPIKNFAGTFDGQGYTISGIYCTGTQEVGLFGSTTDAAVIQNLRIENSYFSASVYWGGSIIGKGTGTLRNVYSEADVYSAGGYVGGLIGDTRNGTTLIENCWYAGNVTSKNSTGNAHGGGFVGQALNVSLTIRGGLYNGTVTALTSGASRVGGFCGYAQGTTTLNISNSLSLGILDGTLNAIGSITGHTASGIPITLNHVYYAQNRCVKGDTTKTSGIGALNGTVAGTLTEGSGVTDVDIDKIKGADAMKLLEGLDFVVTWVAVREETPILQYFVTEEETIDFADTRWYNETDTAFTLSDTKQLYGFAKLALEGNNFANKVIKLDKDITLNTGDSEDWSEEAPQLSWTPIPSFAGTFDGQGNTIRGIYCAGTQEVGLFGSTTDAAVIQNLRIENSYFSASVYWVGSIIGKGTGTLRNVYSEADVYSAGGYVGGLIGDTRYGTTLIENCWFDGNVKSTQTSGAGNCGGFIGQTLNASVTMTNCLYSGTVYVHTTSAACIGGFIGSARRSSTIEIRKSLSVGTLDASYVNRVGSVIGTGEDANTELTVTDTYYAQDACLIKNVKNTVGIGAMNGTVEGTVTEGSSATDRKLADITGLNADSYLPGLDFVNTWDTVLTGTPVLKTLR